ncbi:Tannase/feruloyl esterase [Xylaria bambusicola]|uniref:Tannase/feruloyl esterase n=1 Tax=Xylaria bambusicola TaxID=326684 RepID=UPI002007C776|nr:Tannase/feruloyl esterase [Xylaria bambusicola]KAI0508673.1 Tannase/feruloyl esterase [Xylaria bambusicola]
MQRYSGVVFDAWLSQPDLGLSAPSIQPLFIYISELDLLEMMSFWILITLAACLATSWPLSFAQRQSSNCSVDYFTSIAPAGIHVERVQYVSAGFFVETGNIAYPTFPTGLPELCAVIINNVTANYRFGMFLPDEWNSRFLTIGSYSFFGGINWLEMGVGVKYGGVVLATDTGHSSGAGDITWANTTLKQVNWAYQALQGSIYLGKALTEAYYGQDIAYSYFTGCSTGGRQGLKQIQLDPHVFDGALIGAPAWDTKHLMPWLSKLATWNLPESAPYSLNDAGLFSRLQDEVLKQCDPLDGVKDNIISSPSACRQKFDITKVRCDVSSNKTSCWSKAQTETAAKIYADYVTSDGQLVYKGSEYGSELEWGTFLLPAIADDNSQNVRRNFDGQYERYFMNYGSRWQTTSYNDSVVKDAEARDEKIVQATADQFDLGAFRKKGKIIMYGGLADNVVPVQHTTYYYNRTVEAMGDVGDFFRYFQIPGMRHCWGTPDNVKAPWMIGSTGQSVQRPPYASAWSVPLGFNDSRHDALLALIDWVEKGREVSQIIASEFNFTDSTRQNIALYRQRPLCVYPKTAQWNGKGNQNDAASWRCQ